VRIGDNVTINGGSHHPDSEHELYTIKDGVIVIKKGAALSNGFKI
jgi:glucose-1-phosphate adenylyltransferase